MTLRPGAKLSVATIVVLAFVSLFAELFASDLPLLCRVDGELYVLPNVTRPADLTRLSPKELRARASWATFTLIEHGPNGREAPLLKPSLDHPCGTDARGRDVLARALHGGRNYLLFATLAVMASVALGGTLGGLGGLFGGRLDDLVGRAVETVSAFPPLVLVLGIQSAVPRPTLLTLFLAIAATRWPEIARLVRADVLFVARRDYVMAARALGASPLRVLRRHIAPNVRGSLVMASAAGISSVILMEASLDFLRLGGPPEAPSWGETMSQFRDAPDAWWLLAFPGALVFATVVAHNVLAEALREALDPRDHPRS